VKRINRDSPEIVKLAVEETEATIDCGAV